MGWICPGVKTPGLVLLSPRDKSDRFRRDNVMTPQDPLPREAGLLGFDGS